MGYELKTNTAVRIPVGPLVDPTDGKTAETGLTVTGISVQIYQMKNDGTAVVRAQFAPTVSGGANDMALVTSSTDGMYDLEITAAQLNWLGNGRISLYDVDGFLVHYVDIQVVSAAFFNYKYGATGVATEAKQDTMQGNVTDILTDTETTLDTLIKDIPTTSELALRTLLAADYTVVGDLGTVQSGDSFAIVNGDHGLVSIQDDVDKILVDTETTLDTLIKDIPTVAEFEARSILAADYVVVGDTIAGVTLCDTCTANSDLVTAAAIKTAMEADAGDLSSLMEALVNKRIWTEGDGNLEMHNDSDVSQGNIAAQVATDGVHTTAKRAVI